MKKILYGLGLVFIFSCQTKQALVEKQNTSKIGGNPKVFSSVTFSEKEMSLEELGRIMASPKCMELYKITKPNRKDNWKAIDNDLRVFLKSNFISANEKKVLSLTAIDGFLVTKIIPLTSSSEKEEAAGFYIGKMKDFNYFNVIHIANLLPELKNYYSKDELRSIISESVNQENQAKKIRKKANKEKTNDKLVDASFDFGENQEEFKKDALQVLSNHLKN